MSKCQFCSNPAKVHLTNQDGTAEALCLDCHNKRIAALTGADTARDIPKLIYLEDCAGQPHTFQIEYMLHPHCVELSAYENYDDGYVCKILGEHGENFSFLWKRLIDKLTKMLSQKYVSNSQWTDGKVVGYVNFDRSKDSFYVVIDGKRYEWSELGKQLGTYEGFQIKIEFADPSDDLF